jgi:hypothetical protein
LKLCWSYLCGAFANSLQVKVGNVSHTETLGSEVRSFQLVA